MTRRRIEQGQLETLIKHLPPSASTLRLLDLDDSVGDALALRRADLAVTAAASFVAPSANGYDAAAAYAVTLDSERLRALLDMLRPGGRLIILDPDGEASALHVQALEAAGYTRILVEELLPQGVLLRGEKPHSTADTLARVQSVAQQDAPGEWKGRYVHLLVHQTPNKPVWALKPGEAVEWQALALRDEPTPALLAFSSLPNAVAFMQPAVLSGAVIDVNKVAKFSRAAAQDWNLLVNPSVTVLDGREIVLVSIDPTRAEAPDE